MLFLLRRWDDLVYLLRRDGFKVPRPAHAPLTTKQMTGRLKDALTIALKSDGFELDSEWDGQLRWTRPHSPIGFAIVWASLLTKYAPEYLRIELGAGFRVPAIEKAVEAICGPLVIAGQKQEHIFASGALPRLYSNPDRPKKRLPFPSTFTFWNVDFRESTVEQIKNTIRHFAIPYFDQIRAVSDLKSPAVTMSAENRAAFLVWLGDAPAALQFLDIELQKPRRYGPEMKCRLALLREAIGNGELQKQLSENSGQVSI